MKGIYNMKLKNNIKNSISKILWYVVIILFSLSIYKVYLYNEYRWYVIKHLKKANFYEGLKELQNDSKEYAQEINMKIKEYYLMPLEQNFLVIGNGGMYKNKKVYGIVLKFYFSDHYRVINDIKEESYITDYEEFKKLKESSLIYKLNDNKLEELYKKVEKKSDMI